MVERPTLTDVPNVRVLIPTDFERRRSRGIKFACVHPSVSGRKGQNGEASGLVPEVLHESRIVDGPGAGSGWSNHVRDSHPEGISNIEYRNLQRLYPVDEVDVDVEPVAFVWEQETAGGWSEHVSRADVRNVDADTVRNVRPLVPHPDDVGEGPEPEPIRERSGEYYVDDEEGWYYRVLPIEDEAERIDDAGTIEDARVYDVWRLDVAGRLRPLRYGDTPFSDPKY